MMNISSTDYYNYIRYTQNVSQTDQTQGQQRTHHKRYAQSTDSAEQSIRQTADTDISGSNKPSDLLDSLVTSGIITQDQEEAIKEAFESARMAYQTQSGSAAAAGSSKNPLDSLVATGTITQDQADAIKSTLESSKKMMMPPPPVQGMGSDPLSQVLGNLVSNGIITSDQETAIQNALQSAVKAYQNQSYPFGEDTGSISFTEEA